MSMIIDKELRDKIQPELMAGEKLLWAGKPAKFPLSFMALYLTAFSVFWTFMVTGIFGVGISSEFGSSNSSMGSLNIGFLLFASLFICAGIGMFLVGLKTLISPSREIYAITNQRGIIISPFFRYRMASLSEDCLKNSERKGRPELGTLLFSGKSSGLMGMMMNPYQTELNAFRKITDPKKVEDLIYKTFP